MLTSLEDARTRFGAPLEARIRAAIGDPESALMSRMAQAHMDTGGKRLRALIPPWVAARAGGDPDRALNLGVGLELIHNATLVHDDLQDGDTHRRGAETLWRRFGEAQAINAGDGLYFIGMAQLAGAPDGPALVRPVCDAMLRVIEGQVMEFQLQLPAGAEDALAPDLAGWERMARGKTGALFGACYRAGAVAAGMEAEGVEAVATAGEELGLLFQVQDDYLDLVGDKGRAHAGSDLAEGKISFPVAWALEHAQPEAAGRLGVIVRADREATDQAMIAEGLSLLEGCGALRATAQFIAELRDRLLASSLTRLTPGLAERILAPVAHAL